MKKILVPTDFSDCANLASEMAILLAGKSGAELIFLHLTIDHYDTVHTPGPPTSLVSHEIKQERYKLQQLVEAAEAKGIESKYELVLGTGQEVIEDFIEPLGIDWLVMGSHGASGIREAIIGSRTQHVIRNINVPCLVVKKPSVAFPKNIVFASTFKNDPSKALHDAVDFVKEYDCTLHLLFVNMLSHLIEEKMAKLTMTKIMSQHTSVRHTMNITETNDKEFGITEFAESINADMIAVAMESKSTVGRILNPVLAEQLINHVSLPVLVLSQN